MVWGRRGIQILLKEDVMGGGVGEVIGVAVDINAVHAIIQDVIKKNNVSFSEVIELLREKREGEKIILIPLPILKERSLGILEAITKYLKEDLNLSYHEIASLLNRDDRPIWNTYNNAKNKFPQRFVLDKEYVSIPVSIFSNRKLGLLENLAKYLKDNLDMKYREIAKLIGRDNRTIWASYNKATKKENDGK